MYTGFLLLLLHQSGPLPAFAEMEPAFPLPLLHTVAPGDRLSGSLQTRSDVTALGIFPFVVCAFLTPGLLGHNSYTVKHTL